MQHKRGRQMVQHSSGEFAPVFHHPRSILGPHGGHSRLSLGCIIPKFPIAIQKIRTIGNEDVEASSGGGPIKSHIQDHRPQLSGAPLRGARRSGRCCRLGGVGSQGQGERRHSEFPHRTFDMGFMGTGAMVAEVARPRPIYPP